MHRRATLLSDIGFHFHQDADFYLHTSSDFRPAGAGKCYSVPDREYVTGIKMSQVYAFSWKDDSGYWFDLINQYHGMGPFLVVVSIIATVLYFVTSSDSGSLVADLIANNGKESHVGQRVFWGITEGAKLRAGGQEGRTIRNMFLYTLSVPFVYPILWFGTYGGAAIRIYHRATFLSDMGFQLRQDADFYLHTSNDFRPAGADKCYSMPDRPNYDAAGSTSRTLK
ncbi:unnamed protein product [Polarella glacialis]|uniref:Uncharacterized protein n=1 Tax=Polarella glacialis TaxID=89957 RepID=A0A813KJX8_POLGL|nr:unnamed protein product [Polarella glacialis]